MSTPTGADVRPLTTGMRRMLYTASGLVFTVGVSLFLLSEQTDRHFAWTIASPLSAAFLGAAYWASAVLGLASARERAWCNARIAVPAALLFTSLTLLVTLLHIDRFHLAAPLLSTRLGTWIWLLVYATVPLIMGLLLLRQLRVPGRDEPRAQPLPASTRALFGAQAALLVVVGLALLIAPAAVVPAWPWALTPLTGRAIGAWLLALGVAAAHGAWENDRRRLRAASSSYAVLALLELVALLRYASEFSWGTPAGWAYVLFLMLMLALGAYLNLGPAPARRVTA